MTYYAGLDVSLRSTNICVINDHGERIAEGKTDSEVADIVAFLDELDVGVIEVGLEAGTLTQYLTYGLQFAGFRGSLHGSTPGQGSALGDAQQD